ncbi:MAG: SMP-30/gluconolactonase/LRE family protein [Proteobacteria bacterium]|nr:SMP-30/gluconolactonase/LRE family protein [Pseudomonadota bacterium]
MVAERFAAVPAKLRTDHGSWGTPHLGDHFDCYIEGLTLDRSGNIYVVDIPESQVLKVTPAGDWSVVSAYDGRPKGLKVLPDGRLLISDNRRGIMEVDPLTGEAKVVLARSPHGHFQACNDIAFSKRGDVIFTDQAASSLAEPNGCVYRWRTDGSVDRVISNAPGPNGLVFSRDESQILVSIVRANAIWNITLDPEGRHEKTGLFIQLSGGIGPDGLALDEEGGLIVAHLGIGTWRFDRRGRPTHFIETPGYDMSSSVAFGGSDRRTLFISEATGIIYRVRMPYAGV